MKKHYLYIIILLYFSLINCSTVFAGWAVLGDAYVSGDRVILTDEQNDEAGAAWIETQIDLSNDFDISFKINLGDRDGNGADGISFALHNDPDGTSTFGDTSGGGEWVGMNGICPAVGIEVDTYDNSGRGDIAADHVGVNIYTGSSSCSGDPDHNNNTAGPVQASISSTDIEDGAEHDFRITWDVSSTTLQVYFDGSLRLTYANDIISNVFSGNSDVYFGFTASTGGAYNLQYIIPNSADVDADKSVTPDTFYSTDIVKEVTYTIDIENNGLVTAFGTRITDTLPAGVTYILGSTTGPTTADPTIDTISVPGREVLYWDLTATPIEPNGGTSSISFMATVQDTAGTYVNDFTVSGDNFNAISKNSTAAVLVSPADFEIQTSHIGDFTTGSQGSFTIDVSNNGPDIAEDIVVTNTLPAGFTYSSHSGSGWTVDTSSAPVITFSNAGPLASGTSLDSIVVTVDIDSTLFTDVTNTVSVTSTSPDPDLANNQATDIIQIVYSDLSTSTKIVIDLNGGNAEPGDTLRYTIELIETGGQPANNINVTDDIPAYTSNFSVINFPGGGTDNSTGPGTGANGNGYLDISGIIVPANSSVTVVFEVDVSATASTGDTISNTATITNPNGLGATPAAPDVIVTQPQTPASGNKQLYLGAPNNENFPSLPQDLSRNPLTSEPSPNRIRLRRNDTPVVWALTPPIQAFLTLNADTPVVLQLRRNFRTQNRTLRITLDYIGAATGTLGSADFVVSGSGATGMSDTETRQFTFNIPTSPITLPAGTQIRLTVDHRAGRLIYVYPYDDVTGNTSQVVLDAATVINVDSVEFYDADYSSGGSILANTTPGTTVYIRSVISDPFGNFDITSANIDIIDPISTTVISGAAMTQVADPRADTKTYEYAYTFPLTGPNGVWTARVTANEGTEGTINHTGIETILVSPPMPDIMMLKSIQILSDPVNGSTNPKSIPGAVMLYTILPTNQGSGAVDTDTVVISDPIPINTEMYVGDDTLSPVTFIDGATSSGLTFTFTSLSSTTDDISFSNDSGSTFTYSPPPIGYDSNVTHIRINPKGPFNGASGGNTPSFQIRFQVRVQ